MHIHVIHVCTSCLHSAHYTYVHVHTCMGGWIMGGWMMDGWIKLMAEWMCVYIRRYVYMYIYMHIHVRTCTCTMYICTYIHVRTST